MRKLETEQEKSLATMARNLNKLLTLDTQHTVMGSHLIELRGSEAYLIAKSYGFTVKPKPKSPEPFLDRKEEAVIRNLRLRTPTSTVAEDARHIRPQCRPPETKNYLG